MQIYVRLLLLEKTHISIHASSAPLLASNIPSHSPAVLTPQVCFFFPSE